MRIALQTIKKTIRRDRPLIRVPVLNVYLSPPAYMLTSNAQRNLLLGARVHLLQRRFRFLAERASKNRSRGATRKSVPAHRYATTRLARRGTRRARENDDGKAKPGEMNQPRPEIKGRAGCWKPSRRDWMQLHINLPLGGDERGQIAPDLFIYLCAREATGDTWDIY